MLLAKFYIGWLKMRLETAHEFTICVLSQRGENLIRLFSGRKNFLRNKSMTRFYELTFRSCFSMFQQSQFNLNSWFPPFFLSLACPTSSFYHSNIFQDDFMIGWREKIPKAMELSKILLIAMLIDIAPTGRNSMGFVSIQFYIEQADYVIFNRVCPSVT